MDTYMFHNSEVQNSGKSLTFEHELRSLCRQQRNFQVTYSVHPTLFALFHLNINIKHFYVTKLS